MILTLTPPPPLSITRAPMLLGESDFLGRLIGLKKIWKGKDARLTLILDHAGQETAQAVLELCGAVESLNLLPVERETMTTGNKSVRLAAQLYGSGLPVNLILSEGTRGNFAELNRQRPVAREDGPVTFAVTLGVHSADEASWRENLEGLEEVLRGAGKLYPDSSLSLSPAGIGQAWNPVAVPGSEQREPPVQKTELSSYLMAMMVRTAVKFGAAHLGFHDLINPSSRKLFEALSSRLWQETRLDDRPGGSHLTLISGSNVLTIDINHSKGRVTFPEE